MGIFFICYTLVFVIFFGTLKFTAPFVFAILFAFMLKRPTKYISKKFKLKGWLASLLTTIIFFISIIAIISLLTLSLTLETIDITTDLKKIISSYSSEINIFLNNLEEKLTLYKISIDSEIITNHISTLISSIFEAASAILQYLIKFLSYIPFIISTTFFTIIATYLFTKSFVQKNNILTSKLKKHSPTINILESIKKLISDYSISYFFLMFISTTISFLIFSTFKINYALTLALLAGLLDILPLLGMAIIYIPLIIFYFLKGKTLLAILLLLSFLALCIIRQILENKLMSSSLGITPIESIIAIFVGMQLNGFLGIVFCLFFVVGYKLFLKTNLLA
ncbi:sporulation integral membrane protein YtvI [uncultured Clostridium sp.]|uniref:sporulation integral membrane protein YtvI n=1 Tax=uncultured Clostridium sp. TaxID=59620 RepID=UPI002618465B|nr:sporulation integral membrane protein YtvI [uncultured Clostridium sp.]